MIIGDEGTADAVRVIRCDERHGPSWDGFVRAHPEGAFYHLFGWSSVNTAAFGHEPIYLAAVRGERICGVFPLVYVNTSFFGKILCSMPFVNYGGICVSEPGVERALLEEARRLAEHQGVDYIEIRSTHKLGEDLLTSEHKVSMTLALDSDWERLWNGLKTKHRTNVRHAYKNDLTVRRGGADLLDAFYAVLSESWKSLGTPLYHKGYFEQVLRTFPDNTAIFIVFHHDEPIAAAFNGHSHGRVEGMWAGTSARYRRLEPTYVLYWEMIKDACQRGFRSFHLGRSTVDSGGEAFKKKWNAFPTQLYWQYIVRDGRALPNLGVTNPKYRFAMSVWRRLPDSVTRVVGPLLAKGVP